MVVIPIILAYVTQFPSVTTLQANYQPPRKLGVCAPRRSYMCYMCRHVTPAPKVHIRVFTNTLIIARGKLRNEKCKGQKNATNKVCGSKNAPPEGAGNEPL